MFSRNLSVPDFVRRFFVSCTQISEAYAVRTLMKFGCDWRKIGHKGRCSKDFERTFINISDFFDSSYYTEKPSVLIFIRFQKIYIRFIMFLDTEQFGVAIKKRIQSLYFLRIRFYKSLDYYFTGYKHHEDQSPDMPSRLLHRSGGLQDCSL